MRQPEKSWRKKGLSAQSAMAAGGRFVSGVHGKGEGVSARQGMIGANGGCWQQGVVLVGGLLGTG